MLKSSKSGLADTVFYSLLSWLIYECYKSVFENTKYSCLCMPAGDVDSLLKKSDSQHESPEDGCPFGPLTQRLLQALVEVSLSTHKCIIIIHCFRCSSSTKKRSM